MKQGKFFLKNCLIYVSKGVIWASEYSLGPQIWGPGGARAPGAPLDPLLFCISKLTVNYNVTQPGYFSNWILQHTNFSVRVKHP